MIDNEEILGAFLLVNDYRILTNEELNDVKSAINCLQQDNTKLKEQRSKALYELHSLKKKIKYNNLEMLGINTIIKLLESNKEDK